MRRTWMLLALLSCSEAASATVKDGILFLGGGASGLLIHESGHLAFDLAFAADPEIHGVSFLGVPFFAISPQAPLTPRERFTITSAGFWTQHATSEILLTRRPDLRHERAPFLKGMLAFDVLSSAGYSAAAFAHAGPAERDTRGMALGLNVDERWIGALLITPALLDVYRYHRPRSKWAKWASRTVKIGMVALVLATETK